MTIRLTRALIEAAVISIVTFAGLVVLVLVMP